MINIDICSTCHHRTRPATTSGGGKEGKMMLSDQVMSRPNAAIAALRLQWKPGLNDEFEIPLRFDDPSVSQILQAL